MKRSYTAETFRKRIELVIQDHPGIFIGTDIIAGFPGETKELFQDSLKLVKELGISKIHSFPFSIRKGTLAETYPETVSKEEKKERVKELNELSSIMLYQYFQKNVGLTLEGIVESDFKVITDNYLKLNLLSVEDSKKLKVGQFISITPTRIEKSQNDFSMFGRLG
jgi:threonylcarbamoyladenosine tRNA methylthiotransferase MtaB